MYEYMYYMYLHMYRYAQTARTIVNVARINEDPNSRLIRGGWVGVVI